MEKPTDFGQFGILSKIQSEEFDDSLVVHSWHISIVQHN
jgi:hypothetical protein